MKSQNCIPIEKNPNYDGKKNASYRHNHSKSTCSYEWVLQCTRPLEVMQPGWLAQSEHHSLAAKWVFNSILFTILQSRVFSWPSTADAVVITHHVCTQNACIFPLQLLNLNNFIHCKFIPIENKSITLTLQCKRRTLPDSHSIIWWMKSFLFSSKGGFKHYQKQ